MSGDAESVTHARVVGLFERAIELAPERRRDFLRRECGAEPGVLARVLALVAQDEEGTKRYLLSPVPRVDVHRLGELCRVEDPPLPHPERIGPWRVLRPLGAGGLGGVYLAEDSRGGGERVALEVVRLQGRLPEAVARRLEREREVLERLEHENVCRVLGGGTTGDGLPYFVMEHVEGAQTLGAYARRSFLGLDRRLALFLQVCDAVAHGHERGILHGDLRPSNVLVRRDGVVKVVHLGVARCLRADPGVAARMTATVQLVGALQYTAPEQLGREPRRQDERSEVYALGVVLYELLTDHPPYEVAHLSLADAERVIRETPPLRPSNPALRGALDAILLRALAKDPARRQESVARLAADLRGWNRAPTPSPRPPGLAQRLSQLARRLGGTATR